MDTVKGIWSVGVGMVQAPMELQREQDSLQTKLLSARSLISRSEWGMFKSMELDALLVKLKYATYDVEDLLREYQDKALRQKLEDTGRSRAGQLISSSLSIVKHLVLSVQRIRDTQDKLDKVMALVEKELSSMGLDHVEPVQFMPTTTETITASQVYGRDTEQDQLMEMLGVTATIDRKDEINMVINQLGMPFTMGSTSAGSKGKSKAAEGCWKSAKRLRGNSSTSVRLAETTTNSTGQVSVLPIFGIGGMGKTTLAQLIYNNARVKAHFADRIWVCVSDLFDVERMTKEIVKTVSVKFDLSRSLTELQTELMKQLKRKKFILVLDDIWQITQLQWESFYAYLRDGLEGSMILVTTRHENIAHLITTSNCKPIQLKGLPPSTFWEFFKKCAFGKENPELYPHLQDIGRGICSKLCGTPLAAKTLGRLLSTNLTEEHWIAINESELWEQEQQEGDILPALRLSYLYLPPQLRRCFAFCCMFPKDYSFQRHKIVGIWVAQGFVAPQGNMRLENIGIRYLDELRGRCLLQTDPKLPNHNRYVMHDLIHDTAQHVSMHECLLMTDLSYLGRHEFRHMSVEVDVDAKSLGSMKNIQHLNRLRSLRFGTNLDTEITWFSLLSNILFLSLEGCELMKLPESICELSSLRYLDISRSHVKELPEKFWCLYSLQVVDASQSRMTTIHKDVTKLINLRQLQLREEASIALSKLPHLGNLSCLQNLSYFTVGNQEAAIAELKGMNQLRGRLCIKSIHNVKTKEEAAEARLVDKKYISELELSWLQSSTTQMPSPGDIEVADSLCPNERITFLRVEGFRCNRLPSWFNPKNLQNLRCLELSRCHWFETFSIPHITGVTQGDSMGQHASSSSNCSNNDISSLSFTHLTSITMFKCNGMKNLDQFLCPKNLPSVESILLFICEDLESIPTDFMGFIHLRDLTLCFCRRVKCPQSQEMVFPHSLRRLYINCCGQLDGSFPSCLQKLTSLTVLYLDNCDNVELIPLDSIPCRNTLEYLRLENCPKLSSIGESDILHSSIKYVEISRCAKLTQVSQPYRRNALSSEEVNEIRNFVRM